MKQKICSKCNTTKPLSDFGKRKDSKDGHTGVCKNCIVERRRNRPKITVDEKRCSKCGEIKPISEFRKSASNIDGHHSNCKQCVDSTYRYKCQTCGEYFNTHHKGVSYCSPKCVAETQKDRVYFNCDYCGKELWEHKTEYNRYKNHYCSLECKGKHHSILYVGENAPFYGKEGVRGEAHPRWNPELTPEEREQGRYIEGYSDFIKNVYKRDNYTCQCCGKLGRDDLHAHHLDGYNWCVEKRTEVNNGITLCEKCHTNFHKQYGRGNNTKEQFEEWIQQNRHIQEC